MQSRASVTRKMVAEEAGVSVTIVSYVINNNRYVDKEKKRRVREAIQKLGYRPNAIARSLKLKKTKHILFIADRVDNEHFGKLIFEIDGELYDKGYLISLAHNRNSDDFIQHTVSRQFDGVIISSISIHDKYIDAMASSGVPVVLMMNREYEHAPEGVVEIRTGLYEGARECVRRLRETGCKSIAYVDRFSASGHFSDMRDLRLKGYVDEMAALGLSPPGGGIITGCRDGESVMRKISTLCGTGAGSAPVDAVLARNDRLALIAMAALRRSGRSIPGDVSVIGFDNSSAGRYVSPALTTMEMDRKAVARALVGGLWSLLEGRPFTQEKLTPNLIVRESTKIR